MLEGYQPIDFSSLFANQGDLGQIRNRVGLSQAAMAILANSTMSQVKIKDLIGAETYDPGSGPAKRTKSLIGRGIDLLSTPGYALANAADDAIAAHQEDDRDSVLNDVLASLGGAVKGAKEGGWAGLTGAFGPTSVASKSDNKIFLGDALIRADTHMSAKDAMKPQNFEEVRRRLKEKRINQFSDAPENKQYYDFDKKEVVVTDQDVIDYLKHSQWEGLAASMIGDPLNFLSIGAKYAQATKGAKDTAEAFDVSKLQSIKDDVNTAGTIPDVAVNRPLADGSYRVDLGASAPGTRLAQGTEGVVKVPDWFNFPSKASDVGAEALPPVAKASVSSVDDLAEAANLGETSIGGKVRPIQSLKYTPGTSDVITPEAWNWASNLYKQHGTALLIDGYLRAQHNLTPGAIDVIRQNLQKGTVPPLGTAKPPSPVATRLPSLGEANTIDPFETIINAPATGIASESKVKNPITGKPKEIIKTPVAKVPLSQMRAASKYSKPEEVAKLSSDLIRRIAANGSVDNAIQRLKTKHPGIAFVHTNDFLEHLKTRPDLVKGIASPAVADAFKRVIAADAAKMGVAPKIEPAQEIIKNTDNFGLTQLLKGIREQAAPVASKNPARDDKIVTDVIAKITPELKFETIPAWVKDPGEYVKALKSHGAFTGPKQVNIWNALTSKHLVNAKTPARFNKALSLLKQAEERLIRMGYTPMSSVPKAGSASIPLRLSQVIEAIGPAAAAMNRSLLTRILAGDKEALATLTPEALQQIELAKAGEALVEAPKVITGVDAGAKAIEDAISKFGGPLSAADTERIVTIGSKVAEDITRQAGGTAEAGNKAKATVKEQYIPKAPGDGFPATNTMAIMSHDTHAATRYKNYSNADKVSRDIVKYTGSPAPRELGKKVGLAALVPEWLGARLNAGYKNADMRPIYTKWAASAKNTVGRRAGYLNNLAKRFDVNDVNLWNEALKAAQGHQMAHTEQGAKLADEVKSIMTNLTGHSGLSEAVALENSVAGRTQLLMGELNANLRRFGLGKYQFSKSGDYSKGIDWMNSWEKWDITNPLDFLYRYQNVVEHTVREKLMFDEIISRFASPKKIAGYTHAVAHPRLQGFYFGPEAASQVNQFTKNLAEIAKPNSKQMQQFDKILSKWKTAVTIYVPSHHIRNIIGDAYFNWLGGVNGARPYESALKVMRSQAGAYPDIGAASEKLLSPEALKKVMATGGQGYTAKGKQTALTMKSGQNVTNDMVYISAFNEGILPTTRVMEDIPDDAAMGIDKIRPLKGKGQKAAHTISEARDHYMRLAHYIDALKKSSKPFEEASKEAAALVRKWHPDGMDLTKFERNVARRIMPFYSWTRKSIPLIVESIVSNPGKIMAPIKANYMLQNLMGIETGPISDPFPTDQLFPDWIREGGIGPIFTGDNPFSQMLAPGDSGYTVVNPSNPTLDTISDLNHPGKMILSNINPMAKIPLEQMFGRDAQTGAPVEMADLDYWAKQVPGVSHVGGLTGKFGVSDTVKDNPDFLNWQKFINLMTAGGVTNTGPLRKSATFDVREYLRSQREGR